MPVPPWIMDFSKWSCRYSHENWREEPGDDSKNNSPTWTKGNHPHDSMLTKEAWSGSVHDLAHIPTQICLADCLANASAKADNLITAINKRRLLDVDIHPNSRTLMEHKALLSTWCRTFMHTRRRMLSSWILWGFPRTNSTRRTMPCDVSENSHVCSRIKMLRE